jgi:hypothetical protein
MPHIFGASLTATRSLPRGSRAIEPWSTLEMTPSILELLGAGVRYIVVAQVLREDCAGVA